MNTLKKQNELDEQVNKMKLPRGRPTQNQGRNNMQVFYDIIHLAGIFAKHGERSETNVRGLIILL